MRATQAYGQRLRGQAESQRGGARRTPPTLVAVPISGGTGIAVGSSGNAYVTGVTNSGNFPTTAGAYQNHDPGIRCHLRHYVQPERLWRLSTPPFSAGVAVQYGSGIAVDPSGNTYVTGTAAAGFPTTAGAFQTSLAGTQNAFVTELNPDALGACLLDLPWRQLALISAPASPWILWATRT